MSKSVIVTIGYKTMKALWWSPTAGLMIKCIRDIVCQSDQKNTRPIPTFLLTLSSAYKKITINSGTLIKIVVNMLILLANITKERSIDKKLIDEHTLR